MNSCRILLSSGPVLRKVKRFEGRASESTISIPVISACRYRWNVEDLGLERLGVKIPTEML